MKTMFCQKTKETRQEQIAGNGATNYYERGRQSARDVNGNPALLEHCLKNVHISANQEHNAERDAKIAVKNAEIENWDKEIRKATIDRNTKASNLESKPGEITRLKQEVAEINFNRVVPAGEPPVARPVNPVGVFVWVGAVLLVVLTIGLYVLYGSLFYSALTGDFESTADALINSNAYSSAEGSTFWLILCLPALVLAIGLLLHYLFKRKLAFGVLLLFAFAIDFTLAYMIADHGVGGGTSTLLDHVFSDKFWIVILCGFVAYLVWGLLLHKLNVEEEFRKWKEYRNAKKDYEMWQKDPVGYAILRRNKEITQHQEDCATLPGEIATLDQQIELAKNKQTNLQREITDKQQDVPDKAIKLALSDYFHGWTTEMTQNPAIDNNALIPECTTVYNNYINTLP